MNLTDYLHQAIPKPCHARPFVCAGRPESCTVIVLGENPATRMDTDWWTFWDDASGFNLERFERDYLVRNKGKFSSTRLRLNRLRQAGLQCLETNVSINERPGGHGADRTPNEFLPLFVSTLPNLKGVVAHGVVAGKVLAGLSLPARVQRHSLRHFRSESYARLDGVIKLLL